MKKYILPLVVFMSAIMIGCSDDDYTPGPQSQGAYFSSETTTEHYFFKDESSVVVTLSRTNSEAAQTFDLQVEDESGLFNVPNQVSFVAGANTALIEITFDVTKLDYVDYPVVITIPESEAYQYGATTYEFILGLDPSLRWEDAGICTYRDDLFTTFFNVGFPQYEVPIQKHMTTSGLYRLVNPYGEYYPMNEPGDYAEGDHYMVIHAENPNAVYTEMSYTGCDWGYGEFVVGSLAGYYIAKGMSLESAYKEGYCGRLVKGVITFPENTWLIAMLNYNGGGLYTSNTSGMFRVVLPGFEVPAE